MRPHRVHHDLLSRHLFNWFVLLTDPSPEPLFDNLQAELGACRMEEPNVGWMDAAERRHSAVITQIMLERYSCKKYLSVQTTAAAPAGTSKSTMSESDRLFW